MDEENSRDGIFNRNFGSTSNCYGTSPPSNVPGRRNSLTHLEDSSHVLFDVADEEDLMEATTPSGSSIGHKPPQLSFGSFSMQYFTKKHMYHDDEDMDTEHTNRMYHMEVTHVPDLTEHEMSRSFNAQVYNQHYPGKDSSKDLADVARVASDLATCLVVPDETKENKQSLSRPSEPMSIPLQLPGPYQNSKILSAFYSQKPGGQSKENSPTGSMSSSPTRDTLSPLGSPSLNRKTGKSKVENRDVNVWAPGSM